MKPILVVLAAGVGSRYGGIKQIEPVGPSGETFIDYSVLDAAREGFGKVVFIIREAIRQDFVEVLGSRLARLMPVEYVMQELPMLPAGFSVPEGRTKPWGTGHALLCARDAVDAPFLVLNADDFYGRDSFHKVGSFLMNAKPSSSEFCMAGYRLANTVSPHGTVSRGICTIDRDGYLVSVEEHTKIGFDGETYLSQHEGKELPLTGNETVSMNFWGFTPAVFPALERSFREFLSVSGTGLKDEFYIPKFVDTLVRAKTAAVKVLPTASSWFGVTYREDRPIVLENVARLVREGAYPSPTWGA